MDHQISIAYVGNCQQLDPKLGVQICGVSTPRVVGCRVQGAMCRGLTRWAASDWLLSLRASEVKYWTHWSTSDWGREASSCRSSSSTEKPWETGWIRLNDERCL